MPQNDNLSAKWREDLGPDWQRVHETRLHTLGNLTLTGYNSEYSDRPFIEKRDMKGGFKESPLRLNEGSRQQSILGTKEPSSSELTGSPQSPSAFGRPPHLTSEVLDAYKPKTEKASSLYSIEDHMHLAAGTRSRELFDALRKELLALDPCVTEEFLKLYVAYKAETNFVDVVPQANRLRLSLNMQFHELYDPREIAKDVTNIGRWGNGDVEVGLASLGEMPYVLGLVGQPHLAN